MMSSGVRSTLLSDAFSTSPGAASPPWASFCSRRTGYPGTGYSVLVHNPRVSSMPNTWPLKQPLQQSGAPLLYSQHQGSLFPALQRDAFRCFEVAGNHGLHLLREVTPQDDGIDLIVV